MLMVAQLCKHMENHFTVHFKWVNFMVCKLYLNKGDEIVFILIAWRNDNILDISG